MCIAVVYFCYFFLSCSGDHRYLHSFPTRRSSDLFHDNRCYQPWTICGLATRSSTPARRPDCPAQHGGRGRLEASAARIDRKSTRLNSSHQIISYAVFCLKKKNAGESEQPAPRLDP